MFLKTLASLVFAPFILVMELIGLTEPEIYFAPKDTLQIATSTEKNTEATKTQPLVVTEKKAEIKPKRATSTVVRIVEKPKDITPIKTESIITNPINEPAPNFEKINTDSRKTIVNILCSTKYNDLSPISGTGVIINGNGLILTNAHIAQYLLLKDFREKDYLKCVGRTGSPAYPKYNLELVYISPDWVLKNKTLLKEQNPTGTGENDYAFLRITGEINNNTPVGNFTYIEPNVRESINKNEPVLLASYPAGFLGGISIVQDLNITSAITTIQDVFTFKDGAIDVVSVGGTVVSQKGSSGGLVVDKNTSLIGIITTSSDGDTTRSRGLNAITIAYINRELQREIGINMAQFLKLDHTNFAKEFNAEKSPILSKIIIDELTRQN